jgi:hypothetical protein
VPGAFYYDVFLFCGEQAGCNLTIPSITCSTFTPITKYSDWKQSLANGETITVKAWCENSFGTRLPPQSATIQIAGNQVMLYADFEGFLPDGWIAGTEACKMAGSQADVLKQIQMQESPIDFVVLPLGETRHVIVGWREDPAFGIVNPMGRYNNRDVLCRQNWELASVKGIATVGGRTYWTKEATIETGQDICCDNTGCVGNYSCDNYHCVQEPTTCPQGGPFLTPDQCGVAGICIEGTGAEQGKFWIQGWSLDAQGCCVSGRQYQQCCPQTCDRLSTPTDKYFCVPNSGCTLISFLKECGPGNCCNQVDRSEGRQWTDAENSPYKTQFCAVDKTCCYGQAEVYRGRCLSSCGAEPPPLCGNGYCDFLLGETPESCPDDCGISNKQECLDRVGDGLFILDWSWVEPTLISPGKCVAEYNWPLVGIVAFVSVVIVVGLLLWKK